MRYGVWLLIHHILVVDAAAVRSTGSSRLAALVLAAILMAAFQWIGRIALELREEQHGMGYRIHHLIQRRVVVIVVGVTGQMVAGIIGRARRAAIHRRLGGGLDTLRAGEQAARRDADLDERAVIRAPAERRRVAGEALRGEVFDEHFLGEVRAGRALRRAGAGREG